MNAEEVLPTFIIESREILVAMEAALLSVKLAEQKTELINAIFRSAHTIKGSAGLFGLEHIVAFTHVVESVLDRARDDTLQMTDDLIALLLHCCDHIGTLVDALSSGQRMPDANADQQGAELLAQLGHYLGPEKTLPSSPPTPARKNIDVSKYAGPTGDAINHWHISLRFGPDTLRNGLDPLSFIRYLATLGEIKGLVTLPDALPAIDNMNPEECYLGFEITFNSKASSRAIDNAFEFVRADCQIWLLPPNSQIEDYRRLMQALPEAPTRVAALFIACGSLTAAQSDATLHALHALAADSGAAQRAPIDTISDQRPAATTHGIDTTLPKQRQAKEQSSQEQQSVRVDADKLDQLINQVSELITAGASVSLIARRTQNTELQESASILSGLIEAVRDSALQLRMVKIGATFNRFQRVVHDVARELGKDILLEIDGVDTELDKTVVEKIGDPLMHLIRNAIDHGIESADIRSARHKPAQGRIRLNAYHDAGSIVISVSDDGAGLQHDKILEKALERGLIAPGVHLSDREIDGLIFEPGFSTADQISNLSGRGVGMDVVKRNITALRGSIDIHSQNGIGTTITVRLPLTLAIIDGFLVAIGKLVFAIPLDMIDECIEFSAQPGHDYTNLRGQILPFIRLRELFAVESAVSRRENIVVLKHAGQKAGLVVDTLLGEFQTVIKPLAKLFNKVKCISGSTILGSGEVALILDVPALVRRCVHDKKSMTATSNVQTLELS